MRHEEARSRTHRAARPAEGGHEADAACPAAGVRPSRLHRLHRLGGLARSQPVAGFPGRDATVLRDGRGGRPAGDGAHRGRYGAPAARRTGPGRAGCRAARREPGTAPGAGPRRGLARVRRRGRPAGRRPQAAGGPAAPGRRRVALRPGYLRLIRRPGERPDRHGGGPDRGPAAAELRPDARRLPGHASGDRGRPARTRGCGRRARRTAGPDGAGPDDGDQPLGDAGRRGARHLPPERSGAAGRGPRRGAAHPGRDRGADGARRNPRPSAGRGRAHLPGGVAERHRDPDRRPGAAGRARQAATWRPPRHETSTRRARAASATWACCSRCCPW